MPDAGDIAGGHAALVRDPGELAEIEDEWRSLAVARANAFVSPDWFRAWLRHYGDGCTPAVVVVRDDRAALRGLFPFVLEGGRSATLRFAGSSLGDHFHPVALPSDETAVAAAAGAVLAAGLPRAPVVVAENVDEGAEWWRTLAAATAYRGAPLTDRHLVLPTAGLRGLSWEDYLAARSRNLRSQLKRKRKALERDHQVAIRWTSDPDDVGAGMATIFRLHDLRWDAREGTSTMTGERARAFHTDFAAAAQARGWLRLGFLEVDSKAVAGWYGWRIGERFAYYQAGFDPAFRDSSVGLLLFAETIRAALEEGAAEYDMLLGDEDYKLRFADSSRPVCTVLVAPRLRPARLLAVTEIKARRAGQRVPASVREPLKRHGRAVLDRLPLSRRR